ncbi:MAG: hypothetical protein CUN52_13950 [Phototrophicales bacterium]|nr:MAG: hypothetical protein CUN52_13950 [Phototrophicales bacterium]
MIEVELLETGIFVYRWIGNISIQETKHALDQITPLLTTPIYSAIVDMSQMKTMPNDVKQIRENATIEIKNGLKGYVILGAPRMVEMFINMLLPLAPTVYQFAKSWDEALDMARSLIR